MEKSINVVVNGVHKLTISIKKNDTVAQLKDLLKDYKGYHVKMYINQKFSEQINMMI